MKTPAEDHGPLRPHSYDGIQEYDKRLPNWWLFTLYGAIVYSVFHWIVFHQFKAGLEPGTAVEVQMRENQQAAARSSGIITDDLLWEMSRDAKIIAAGQATYTATCASCHLPTMTGQIGPNLVDEFWIHGGNPLAVMKTIDEGILAKGMPAWAPVLGKQKISEVTAFILSRHKEGAPVKQAPPWVPGQVMSVITPPTPAAN